MDFTFEPITSDHRKSIIDIFNYYIENNFAAYPENQVPYDLFDHFIQATAGFPTVAVKDKNGTVIGFGTLRPYNPISTFFHTAEITYFIMPEFTGQGIGSSILDYLTQKAVERGVTSLLASISSKNEGSINFHKKHGFVECGRFRNIGKKNGQFFDVVWMQKTLN